jgi:hypothetical protein
MWAKDIDGPVVGGSRRVSLDEGDVTGVLHRVCESRGCLAGLWVVRTSAYIIYTCPGGSELNWKVAIVSRAQAALARIVSVLGHWPLQSRLAAGRGWEGAVTYLAHSMSPSDRRPARSLWESRIKKKEFLRRRRENTGWMGGAWGKKTAVRMEMYIYLHACGCVCVSWAPGLHRLSSRVRGLYPAWGFAGKPGWDRRT